MQRLEKVSQYNHYCLLSMWNHLTMSSFLKDATANYPCIPSKPTNIMESYLQPSDTYTLSIHPSYLPSSQEQRNQLTEQPILQQPILPQDRNRPIQSPLRTFNNTPGHTILKARRAMHTRQNGIPRHPIQTRIPVDGIRSSRRNANLLAVREEGGVCGA